MFDPTMLYRLLALFYLFVLTALGLRVTPGSPCEEKCGPVTTNTTGADVVCRDYEYSRKPEGVVFQDCVKCELRSTFEHRRSYQSDLKWGLYNLRYAFSSCIYAFPVSKQSLSTPCQVTCDSLMDAVKYQLLNPVPQEAYDFCGMDSFSDDFVTKCALCYSLTDDEKLIGNFIEAIREGCHSKVPSGHEFIIDPDRIFNTTLLPPSTESIAPPGTEPKGKKNLVLVIVLPIVGFLLLCLVSCFCCFFYIRRRRRKARQSSHAGHLHERWNDTSIMTPVGGGLRQIWGETSPQMHPAQAYHYNPASHNGYYGGEQDIKYPPEVYQMGPVSSPPDDTKKAEFVTPTVPTLSAPPPGRKSLSTDQ
ncbi:hypothetical protein D8B26_004847 [Coccidioides posadasii str. Silveira]|uniref:Uncharacterized protein n=3 Tax=Coccidioides posadasii TaxID=199306 RepID=E9D6E1_COCPS|nr:conserved hypothetical protein [Coccidioides posadasii str. Silveira]KMM68505.1 hypothetical protein CPAG_04832 [Coccidioides posadasii RMSCC 3488]QVM10185.1 hypothetical protein D8B26_004847 [Coccidioides posadasii str. Silveira]